MKKPMTTEELFHKILDILKDKGRLPEILDYSLADGNPVPITTYEFELRSNLNYGGSEGIYGLSILTKGKNASTALVHLRRYMKMKKPCTGWPGFWRILWWKNMLTSMGTWMILPGKGRMFMC